MLVFGPLAALTRPDTLSTHRTLALTPHLLLGLSLSSSVAWVAWIHVRAAKARRTNTQDARDGSAHEQAPLLAADDPQADPAPRVDGPKEGGDAPTGWELLLEAAKVVVAVALLGLSVARLVGLEGGRRARWTRVLEGGVVANAVRHNVLGRT